MKFTRSFSIITLILLCMTVCSVFARAPTTPKIVFASAQDGDRDIYLMNPDGSEKVNLTRHPADDVSPVWSPTGEQILFVSNRDGVKDLFLMDANGSNVRKVFDKSAIRRRPTWSPDGKQIVYNYGQPGSGLIYIGSIDGEKEEKVVIGHNPAWSPDGKEIAFVEGEKGKPKWISLLNVETYQSQFFFPIKAPSWVGEPAWSPRGNKLAFTWYNRVEFRVEDVELTTIYIVNRNGRATRQVLEEGWFAASPAWSPRGDELLFNAKDLQMFKIALHGGEPVQLTAPNTLNYKADWFDPAYALPVSPQPKLLTTTWGQLKKP